MEPFHSADYIAQRMAEQPRRRPDWPFVAIAVYVIGFWSTVIYFFIR